MISWFTLVLFYKIFAKQFSLLDQNSIQSYDFISNLKLSDLTLFSNTYQLRKQLEFNAFNQSFKLVLKAEEQFGKYYVGDEEFPLPQITYSGEVYDGHEPIPKAFSRLVIVDDHIDGVISTPAMGLLHIKSTKDYSKARREQDAVLASPLSRPTHQKYSKFVLIRDVDPAKSSSDTCKIGDDPNRCAFQDMLVKRDSKPTTESSCGVNASHVHAMREADTFRNTLASPFKRDFLPTVNLGMQSKASACPLPSKQLLAIGVAADCSYVVEKGGVSEALAQILSNFNSASAVFEKAFNVQLGVAKVSIQQACSPVNDPVTPWNVDCSNPAYTIADRLSDFSRWRGTVSSDGLGHWHLMTKCATQPAVGIAWLKMLCQTGTTSQNVGGSVQVVSGTGISSIVPVEWKVVAHEMGHTFGAIHDCSSTVCDRSCTSCSPNCDCGGEFLMNPLDNAISDAFSPQSIASICEGITSMGSCLQAPDALQLVSPGFCGNGIKEPKNDEECDCGPPDSPSCLNSNCCDGNTCKLKANMKCEPLNDLCCTDTCMIKPSTEICHRGDDICDRTVTCPGGDNPTCPFDTFVADGTQCTSRAGLSATCASGQCTSRDQQCVGDGAVTTVKACPQFGNDCRLNCQDARGNCYQLTGNFLDGTTCGGTGRCKKGVCEGSTIFSQALLWIETFPQYAWPIIIILGLIILSAVFSCIKGCLCGRRNTQRAYTAPLYPQAYAQSNSTNSQAALTRPQYVGNQEQGKVPKIVNY